MNQHLMKNRLRGSMLAIAIAAPLLLSSLPASAGVDLIIKIAPPAPRVEVAPPPRVGYVWVPGYWDYRGARHVWVAGAWERERVGYRYVAPVWVERNGEWHLTRGQWARGDRDHDGVPNAVDRDRDGDGIKNRRDPQPTVPN